MQCAFSLPECWHMHTSMFPSKIYWLLTLVLRSTRQHFALDHAHSTLYFLICCGCVSGHRPLLCWNCIFALLHAMGPYTFQLLRKCMLIVPSVVLTAESLLTHQQTDNVTVCHILCRQAGWSVDSHPLPAYSHDWAGYCVLCDCGQEYAVPVPPLMSWVA